MRSILLAGFVLGFLVSGSATARTSVKKKDYLRLVEANVQRTLPGIPGVPIRKEYHIVIVWQAVTYPKTFFWRGENGWLPCSILQTDRAAKNGKALGKKNNRDIHPGDTLRLTPLTGGKFPVPEEIPADVKNTLFFQTGSSGWLSYQVKKVSSLPDIVNP